MTESTTKEFVGINAVPATRDAVNELKTEIFGTESATQDDVIRELIREAGYGEVFDDE